MYRRIVHEVLSNLHLKVKENDKVKLNKFLLYYKDVYCNNTFLKCAQVTSYNTVKESYLCRENYGCAEHNTEKHIAKMILSGKDDECIVKMYTLALLNMVINEIRKDYNIREVRKEVREHIEGLVKSLSDISWFDYRSKNTYPFDIEIDFTSWKNIAEAENSIIKALIKSLNTHVLVIEECVCRCTADFITAEIKQEE